MQSSPLQYNLPLTLINFVNPRYWQDETVRTDTVKQLHAALADQIEVANIQKVVIDSPEALAEYKKSKPSGVALFTAMSGAVQLWMLELADEFEAVLIGAGYSEKLVPENIATPLLELNAAPATLEVFSVLKNRNYKVYLINQIEQVGQIWRAVQAVVRLRKTRFLQIGDTESWVLSSERNLDKIKSVVGIDIKKVPLEELYQEYHRIDDDAAQKLADNYSDGAKGVVEPTGDDLLKAARLVLGFEKLMEKYEASAVAIACFSLLAELGTTSCLALSYLNDHPAFIGACEGDVDSAITLALLKALAEKPAWMGNPMVDGTNMIDIAHCTSALALTGEEDEYQLRSHHESGIGVSPEVKLPTERTVTLTRLSVAQKALAVTVGTTKPMPRKPTCRTQIRVEIPSFEKFMQNMLGLHQTLVFGDLSTELKYCAKLLGLDFLN
ncbi:hypothetical protein KAH55_00180 [bacterium]|nr:hypothetical protein [bacterium]